MIKSILISLAITVAGILTYHYFLTKRTRIAFIHNQTVFEEFKGKLELEEKINTERKKNKKLIDSLQLLVAGGRTELKDILDERTYTLNLQQEERSARYTADIWRFINESIAAYGKENNYDYILGATGNGSLMFANPEVNITNDIIRFCNDRYSGVINR
ncbi:MAG: OmpH family outer membrane protein [Cyclobacteriaceae bacterium]|nr:OmpH family outer membrane protein [Cyclobacteriaceae bacterium]MBX2957211.1 OmpH family outer membrane protein [Cyclobacteriaceae bacterium]